MAEIEALPGIDLIPPDYRSQLRQGQSIRVFAAVLVTVLCLGAATYAGLRYTSHVIAKEVDQLEQKTLISSQQRDQITRLRQLVASLEAQLALLRRLRSGGEAQQMFLIVDRALVEGEVWFLRWDFRRAGFNVATEKKAVNTGYFIVVPDGGAEAEHPGWEVETHMTVKGQARDHAALSRFVRRLFEQPEIQDVRVVRTSRRQLETLSVVDFDLAVVVRRTTGATG